MFNHGKFLAPESFFTTFPCYFSFPNKVQGTIFACITLSNLVQFVLIPVVKGVKADYETGWVTYRKWMTLMTTALTAILILVSCIAFGKLPRWLHEVKQTSALSTKTCKLHDASSKLLFQLDEPRQAHFDPSDENELSEKKSCLDSK